MTTRIFWAGDSTVKQNDISSYPQTGIGQTLSLYLRKGIGVENYAENGRSTKSFLEEGILATIAKRLKKDDFLMIQFGHNDEKPDPLRYTEPFGSYQENLTRFVTVAKHYGAHPVLITPLYRRLFDEHGILHPNTHLLYPSAMIELGEKLGIPVIDLCTKSQELIQSNGVEQTASWFMNLPPSEYPNYPDGKSDNTHLQYAGAVMFAGLIAESLRAFGGIYESLLLPRTLEKEDAALLLD